MTIKSFKELNNNENLAEALRFKIVRARIRKGKVQRRKKISAVKGFTFRGGRLIRMTPLERLRRRIGQRRGKIKRKAMRAKIRIATKRAMFKRKSLGIGTRR